jgi:LacI family transcriptional regulator
MPGLLYSKSFMAKPRPTLRSLAAEAGVSAMTVSLALRNRPEVSAPVRQKLQRLAEARGYKADPIVARLMHRLRAHGPQRFRSVVCGLAASWPQELRIRGHYLERLHAGLSAQATRLGYGFELINVDEYPTSHRLTQVLSSRGIEGIVVLPLREPGSLAHCLDWSRFATVSVASSLLAPAFHHVTPHHFDNMLRACAALRAEGYQRIGLAISRNWDARVHHRWTGGIAWQNQFGGTEPVEPLLSSAPGLLLDPNEFSTWLKRARPDAVISDTWDPALLAATVERLPAKRRPRIVSLNYPGPGAACGIDQRAEEIGHTAINILASLLTRGERGIPDSAHGTLVEGRWHAG